jgi:hypothetical protein
MKSGEGPLVRPLFDRAQGAHMGHDSSGEMTSTEIWAELEKAGGDGRTARQKWVTNVEE